jgi:hypothetical protein
MKPTAEPMQHLPRLARLLLLLTAAVGLVLVAVLAQV